MPDPKDYKDEESWMGACIPKLKEEGKDQDQAVAQCMNMWKEREKKDAGARKEVRVLPVSELRFEDESPKFEGYAAVFNKWSEDLGGFRERIRPSAFRNALKKSDVRALFNHDANYVLGRSTSGTLKLREDEKGLHISNDPPDTQWAKDLMVSVKRGDISQMSFGFTVGEDEWNEDKDGTVSRTIHKIDQMFDISVVTYPAYPDTSVALRSLEKVKAKHEETKPMFSLPEGHYEELAVTSEDIKEIVSRVVDEVMQKNNSGGEPKQADGENKSVEVNAEEKEGENSEPKQGEEVRTALGEKQNEKFKKHGMEFFLS